MEHLPPLIHDLAIILGAAAFASFLFHRLHLPVILGYIAVGVAVGPASPLRTLVTDIPSIRIWGELGVVFLMFTLGLDFSFRRLAAVGIRAGATGGIEVICLIFTGFAFGRYLGWGVSQSLFLGATIAISSTTILLKSMENLGLRRRRFADTVFGILIIEDMIAILLLVGLSTMVTRGSLEGADILMLGLRLLIVVGTWMLVGFFLVPRFLRMATKLRSNELLTILAVGLCLSLVVLASRFGFSPALGAFIMGSIIGETRESRQIEDLIRPMRDMFVAIFFVSIGILLDPSAVLANPLIIVALTAMVILGKFVFVTLGSILSGYGLRHSVQAGLAMGQIGEFSFLIAGLGVTLGVASPSLSTIVVAVSLLTTLTTPIAMRLADVASYKIESWVPETWRVQLEKYSTALRSGSAWRSFSETLGSATLRWVSNGILVTTGFAFSADLAVPWINKYVEKETFAFSIGWLLACLLTAPFLWGMMTVFPRALKNLRVRHARLIVATTWLLTVVWIGGLSLQFLSAWTSALIMGGALLILLLLVYPKLEASYGWFESKFLSTFSDDNPQTQETNKHSAMRRLAPWDAHLVQLNANPDSEVVGSTLVDAKLRERHGLNVVAIRRGSRIIVAPPRNERIYPNDELLVLGTDEQVEGARELIEGKDRATLASHDLTDYEMKPVIIKEGGALCRKSILSSELREKFGALVVGVERDGRRIMNPPSQMILTPGDLLWVVGDRSKLRDL